MDLVSPTNDELLANSIGFYIPSVIFLAARIVNNAFVLKELKWDDFVMMVVFFLYTTMLALINASGRFATNLFPEAQLATILADPDDVNNRIIGSILVIPLEQCMLFTIWGVKACLLSFIYRLTVQMPTIRMILYCVALYIALGLVIIEVCYYGVLCRPFSQYWAVPADNPQCATYSTYSKIQMVFNISSDLMIITLPSSIIYRSALPLKRKIALMGLFMMGIFTILAAILNKYYNFSSPETTVYALWYIREASVAIWVGNLICCWQLLQKIFHLRSFDNKSSGIKKPERTLNTRHSIGGHTKNSAWYSRMIASRTPLEVESEDLEKSLHGKSTCSGDTIHDHFETGTLFHLTHGDDDAGPALAYRHTQHID